MANPTVDYMVGILALDPYELATGNIRIRGVPVAQVSDQTDDAFIKVWELVKEVACDAESTPEDINIAHFLAQTAKSRLPAKYKNHQFLHLIEHIAYPALKLGLMGADLDAIITEGDQAGEDTRLSKHYRQITKDGSLIRSIEKAHSDMVALINSSGVLCHDLVWSQRVPGWEGYHPKLISYAVHLLHESLVKLAILKQESAEMGYNVDGDGFGSNAEDFIELPEKYKA
ncbi:hypothetical protein TI39_contig602g00005 [Zymoseptoria brevis]|uniref:Uncharacterized protein n=1 Tax=Zymoseptoria brevis TaxID=1047168 RepID=A0A0F4GHJ4_9PEZI|nr:hypothetical protein TI39_contig602g00005 [Zymoseptoria brevis]